jgi:hypothetical protein
LLPPSSEHSTMSAPAAAAVVVSSIKEGSAEQFLAAMRLKAAIDRAPTFLTSIGSVVNKIGRVAEWEAEREENSGSEDEEDEEEEEDEDHDENMGEAEEEDASEEGSDESEGAAESTAEDALLGATKPEGGQEGGPSVEATATTSASSSPLKRKAETDEVAVPTQRKAFKSLSDAVCRKLYRLCTEASRSVVVSHKYYESSYNPTRPFKTLKGNLRIKFRLPPAESRAQQDAEAHTDIPADATELTYDGPVNRVPVKLLRQLWQYAHPSGFGDVKSQTTKVDAEVRNARELLPEEFEVDPAMSVEIARVWSENLFPKRVHAVPYKINIYGPGGHFSVHKDTPQLHLVGSALIGLGDDTNTTGLRLGAADADDQQDWKAQPGQYVMFYPDVPHEVLKITRGYRATIAFKLVHDVTAHTHKEMDAIEKTYEKKCDVIKVSTERSKIRYNRPSLPCYYKDVDRAKDEKKQEELEANAATKLKELKQEMQAVLAAPRKTLLQVRKEAAVAAIEETCAQQEEEMDNALRTELSIISNSLPALGSCTAAERNENDEKQQEAQERTEKRKDKLRKQMQDKIMALQAALPEDRQKDSADDGSAMIGFDATRVALLTQVRSELLELATPFGFLLSHKYSLNNANDGAMLAGADRMLYDILASQGEAFRLRVFPVLTKYHSQDGYDGDSPDDENQVYPLTDKHVDYLMLSDKKRSKRTQPPTPGFGDEVAQGIRFLCSGGLDSKGFEWQLQKDDGAEHSGNDSRPAEEDSIYLHKALVVTRRSVNAPAAAVASSASLPL